MLVIELGNEGYLKKGAGQPTHTTSIKEAREFETKKQASRIIERLKLKSPELICEQTQIIPLNRR